ncbi:MAG: T9SS type A sorting domain-containing protein [Bacteroidota bacterium]
MKTTLSLILLVFISSFAFAQSPAKPSLKNSETKSMNVSTVRESADDNPVFACNDQASEVNNPTSHTSIKSKSESAVTMSVCLVNTAGKVLMQQELTASDTAIDIKLPKKLPAGLYLIKVKGCPEAETQAFSIH